MRVKMPSVITSMRGAAPDLRAEAGAVADRLAGALAERGRHPLGGGAGGDAARLQHEKLAAGDPRLVQQSERHARGLARAGRGYQHGGSALAQRRGQRRQRVVDGQGRGEGDRHRAMAIQPVADGWNNPESVARYDVILRCRRQAGLEGWSSQRARTSILRGPAAGRAPQDDVRRSGKTIPDIACGNSGMTIEFLCAVIPGLDPGIHALSSWGKTWMAGSSPAMTICGWDTAEGARLRRWRPTSGRSSRRSRPSGSR